MHRMLLLVFLWVFCLPESRAQHFDGLNYTFKQYSVAEGLSDNTVLKTVKDANGFLWIATQNGISRFDGSHFKSYTPHGPDSSGLRSGWVSDLIIDNAQHLWASTEGGLCYYDEAADHFVYINNAEELQLIFKMPLANGANNELWVVAEDGLRQVNIITKKYQPTSLKRVVDPQCITYRGQEVIIGTRGHGLFRYSIKTDRFENITVPGLAADVHFMGFLDAKGGTWIACSEGLLWFAEGGTFMLYNQSTNRMDKAVSALMCVSDFANAISKRYLLCGSYDKKLWLFDTVDKKFCYQWRSGYNNPYSFNAAVLYHLQADGNLLWISGNTGLQLINLDAQQQQSYFVEGFHEPGRSVFVKKAVQSRAKGQSEVWMIPWQPQNGLLQYNIHEKKTVNHFNGNGSGESVRYNDLIESRLTDEILAAGVGRLDIFKGGAGQVASIKLPGIAYCIREDATGNFWVGMDDGIIFFNRQTKELQHFTHHFLGTDLENNIIGGPFPIHDIVSVNDSVLWLANLKFGLFSFNVRQKHFDAYRQQTGNAFSAVNRCVSLAMTDQDSLFVGTFAGLSSYSISKKQFSMRVPDNIPGSNYIYSLVTDSYNRIWARNNSGLYFYDPSTGIDLSYKLDGEADITNYQQVLTINRDHIVMGHEGGFTIFDTKKILSKAFPAPALYINRILINNNELLYNRKPLENQPLSLAYYENQISFQPTAIEYNNPASISFVYKLEGVDKQWKEGGTRNTFNYNFLPYGKYRFCIFARNTTNNTKSNILYFSFVIQPAWWQHWWLWLLVALVFVGMVLYLARRRVLLIRNKEAKQTALNKAMAELELKMLRSQMNPHFIFNSLNSIQKYIWGNREEDAADYLSRFAKLMRAILDNSRKDMVSIREEMDNMKLYIELEHRRSNGSFEYHLLIDDELDQAVTMIPPMIMQPFIENAIWHGLNKKEGRGHLKVSIQKQNDQLLCLIEDDGAGFEDTHKPDASDQASLGIEITRQRLEKLMKSTGRNAGVHIRSTILKDGSSSSGTVVSIDLPLQIVE